MVEYITNKCTTMVRMSNSSNEEMSLIMRIPSHATIEILNFKMNLVPGTPKIGEILFAVMRQTNAANNTLLLELYTVIPTLKGFFYERQFHSTIQHGNTKVDATYKTTDTFKIRYNEETKRVEWNKITTNKMNVKSKPRLEHLPITNIKINNVYKQD